MLTTLRHSHILSILIYMPSLITAASSSTDPATITHPTSSSKLVGPRSLQKLACINLAYNQRYQVYWSWAPVDIEQTSGAIMDALKHSVPEHSSSQYKKKIDTWRMWADEGIELMESYRSYIHSTYPYNDDFLECSRLRSILENDSIDAETRDELAIRLNCIIKTLQQSPKSHQLRMISLQFINGLDTSRITYTPTKLSYENELSQQLAKFQKAQSSLERDIEALILSYNNLGIDMMLPSHTSADVSALRNDKIGPVTLQELAIKALVYDQRYHIYSMRKLHLFIDSSATTAMILDGLKHLLFVQAQKNDPEASANLIIISPDLHSLAFKSSFARVYNTHSIDPRTAAHYHRMFDRIETMLNQPQFNFKALRELYKKFNKMHRHFQDLPKPKDLATIGNRVINGLDTTLLTYTYTKNAYTTWLTEQLTALTGIIHRFEHIKQRYNDLRINEQHQTELDRNTQQHFRVGVNNWTIHLEGHHWSMGY